MQVKLGDNGWPGTFIPGDESLSLASSCELAAQWIETKMVSWEDISEDIATFLRRTAKNLRQCRVDKKPDGP